MRDPYASEISFACVPLPSPEDQEARRRSQRYLRKPSYERIIICDSIWRIVSSATPTTMITEVPPSARDVACEKLK
jgi:hypothetical protein